MAQAPALLRQHASLIGPECRPCALCPRQDQQLQPGPLAGFPAQCRNELVCLPGWMQASHGADTRPGHRFCFLAAIGIPHRFGGAIIVMGACFGSVSLFALLSKKDGLIRFCPNGSKDRVETWQTFFGVFFFKDYTVLFVFADDNFTGKDVHVYSRRGVDTIDGRLRCRGCTDAAMGCDGRSLLVAGQPRLGWTMDEDCSDLSPHLPFLGCLLGLSRRCFFESRISILVV